MPRDFDLITYVLTLLMCFVFFGGGAMKLFFYGTVFVFRSQYCLLFISPISPVVMKAMDP